MSISILDNTSEIKRLDSQNMLGSLQLLGKQIALDVKEQVGEDVEKMKVKPNKRKGQISLEDYRKE